ncbi:MAG: SMP-30/gluconolactonase/LRE family protein [Myxococcota bacterium]
MNEPNDLFRCVAILAALGLGACEEEEPPEAASAEGAEDLAEVEPVEPEEPAEPEGPSRVDVADVGFETPESVLYDEEADRYLVSNVNGSPTDEDDDGFISQVSSDGEVTELKWIDGAEGEFTLNAPKGMAIVDDSLYVSDLNAVRVFDRESGEHQKDIAIEGSQFLNDVAADSDGVVYVSDTGVKPDFSPAPGKAAVYRIDDEGKAEKFAEGEDIGQPNGLVFDDGLWVADFDSSNVRKLDDDGSVTESWEAPEGGLDGLVVTSDGAMIVSSWEGKALYVRQDDEVDEVQGNLDSPADIGLDTERDLLLIPLFNDDKIVILPRGE